MASRLAPHSLSIRVYFVMLSKNRRVVSDGQIDRQLRRLCQSVMDRLGIDADGVFQAEMMAAGEPPNNYRAAVAVMRAPDYVGGELDQAQQESALRSGADEELLAWIDGMVALFARWSVPLYAHTIMVTEADHHGRWVRGETALGYGMSPYEHGLACELRHGTLGLNLPEWCWRIVADAGGAVARRLRLEMLNGRDVGGPPQHFERGSWRRLVERVERHKDRSPADYRPVALRRNWSSSPAGERAMLLEYYGIRNEPWFGDPYGPPGQTEAARLEARAVFDASEDDDVNLC